MRGERGGSNAIAAALLLPAVLIAILSAVQAGVWLNGRNATLAAAETAAEAERLAGARPGAGSQAASGIGAQAGVAITTTVTRNATQVTATATGTQEMFIPIPNLGRHTQTVTLPLERVTQP